MMEKRVRDILTEEELEKITEYKREIIKAISHLEIRFYKRKIIKIIEAAKKRYYDTLENESNENSESL